MSDAKVEHLIVLMFENRSFDHLLGYLSYPPGVAFEGINGREQQMGNPLPQPGGGVQTFYPNQNASYFMEFGPNHSHEAVMQQLLGQNPRAAPYRLVNNGFAENYEAVLPGHAGDALQCFPPDKLPVLARLAQEFAVCDHWFCSVPGATWPNRNYAHAATSDGEVEIHARRYDNPTIYQQLSGAQRDWAVYYSAIPAQTMAFTRLWMSPRPNWYQRFKPIQKLYRAIRSDRLPHYAFVEPVMLGANTNSQHPGMGGEENFKSGEQLIWQVYTTLRQNEEVFKKTLLLVLYDEHGGFFDHVPPPQGPEYAMSKVFHDPQKNYTFDFSLLGPRVPAVLISPWIERQTVDSTEYEHASIPATARKIARVRLDPLTTRDGHANTFEGALRRTQPRTGAELPEIHSPFLDSAARPKRERVELEDSLVKILTDLVWQEVKARPQEHLQALLERGQAGGQADIFNSVLLPAALHESVLGRVLPQLSAEARAALDELETLTGIELPPAGTAHTLAVQPQVVAFNLFIDNLREKLIRLLMDQALIDDALRFADLVFRALFEDHRVVLRTVDGRSLEQPDDPALAQELSALFANPDPAAHLWLADYQDFWLTVFASGRVTFEDLQHTYELDAVPPAQALKMLQDLRAGNVQAIRGRLKVVAKPLGDMVGAAAG